MTQQNKSRLRTRPSRRDVLKLTGALAATAAAAPTASALAQHGSPPAGAPSSMTAQSAQATQSQSNAVYVSHEFAPQAADAPPIPLPPLRVIALTRLAFGQSLYDTEGWNTTAGATETEKFTNWVNTQLSPDFSADTDCNSRIAAANLVSLNKSLKQLWTDYMNNPTDNPDFNREDPANDVYFATFIRAIYSKWQLFEVIADFWHNHFNIYAWDYSYASATFAHFSRDVIRANAFGNFRAMLEAVAKSPAMLFYLDNYINTNAGPNENWARELMELHTLGAENYDGVKPYSQARGYPTPTAYVDADVYSARECFTGWRVNDEKRDGDALFTDEGNFLFENVRHSIGLKRVLNKEYLSNNVIDPSDPDFARYGSTPEHEGLRVLDSLAKNPGVGRFIVRKLWRRLIGDTVPAPGVLDAFFDAVVRTFTDNWQNPNQIRLVVQQLLLGIPANGSDPAIPSPFATVFGDKIKRPLEAAVSMLRAVGAQWQPKRDFWDFFDAYEAMGQGLFARRPPDGYPDVKEAWNNTTSILMRWRFCNWMMEEGTPKDRPEIQVDVAALTLGVFPSQTGRTPNAVADYWINRILGQAMMNAESRKAVVDMLARGANPATYQLSTNEINNRAPDAIALILMSPDFQLR